MGKCYLLLGSNQGDRLANLNVAIAAIAAQAGDVVQVSTVYTTAPWGNVAQDDFLNQSICIETTLPPMELLSVLKGIERLVGRVDTVKWGPRIIDIDILLYGDTILQTDILVIPHPYLHERRFALIPLAEIAAGVVHPVLAVLIHDLLATCTDTSVVNRLG